jgi:hypothetical protein
MAATGQLSSPMTGSILLIFAITCPFALLNHVGRRRVLDAYADDLEAGLIGLVMEHLAVSLNPPAGPDGQ